MPTKKLIEVALPLEKINEAAAREKSIRHGHPSTLHLWWARRPLAACRAVLFASIVDDPSSHPDQFPTETAQEKERRRLFDIIERMVPWENSNNPHVLKEVREEIRRACSAPCPPETDEFEAVNHEGNKFDGYQWAEDAKVELQEMAQAMLRQYESSGQWRGNFNELRATLFYLLRNIRATYHGWDEDPQFDQARSLYSEIRRRWEEIEPVLPSVLDPFCGGGSIPLEAQRLGLEAHGSDLNPVAVLITKALIEIPPKFANCPPVNPEDAAKAIQSNWVGAAGLAVDVRYYGKWMREEAQKRIGHLYPKATLPNGQEATVIAWLWARTAPCPNPACGARMPLVRSWALSTKAGKSAWVEAKVVRSEGVPPKVEFEIATGPSVPADKKDGTVNRQGATCICCDTHTALPHIRTEGKAGRMSAQLMAIVAEGIRERIYLAPTVEHEETAREAKPEWKPESNLPKQALGFRVQEYGMTRHSDLFTSRQLAALTTFSDLVKEAKQKIEFDTLTKYQEHSTPPPPPQHFRYNLSTVMQMQSLFI